MRRSHFQPTPEKTRWTLSQRSGTEIFRFPGCSSSQHPALHLNTTPSEKSSCWALPSCLKDLMTLYPQDVNIMLDCGFQWSFPAYMILQNVQWEADEFPGIWAQAFSLAHVPLRAISQDPRAGHNLFPGWVTCPHALQPCRRTQQRKLWGSKEGGGFHGLPSWPSFLCSFSALGEDLQ